MRTASLPICTWHHRSHCRPLLLLSPHILCCATQIDLYENGTIAIVEAVSPELGNRVQRVRVQLPGTSAELLNKFREKKIDFAAHSNTEDGGAVFLNLLGEAVSSKGRLHSVSQCIVTSSNCLPQTTTPERL
jgi:hypothetical protein